MGELSTIHTSQPGTRGRYYAGNLEDTHLRFPFLHSSINTCLLNNQLITIRYHMDRWCSGDSQVTKHKHKYNQKCDTLTQTNAWTLTLIFTDLTFVRYLKIWTGGFKDWIDYLTTEPYIFHYPWLGFLLTFFQVSEWKIGRSFLYIRPGI